MFAFYFNDKWNSKIEPDMTLGYYDTAKFKGEMRWHPILFKHMYGIKLDDIKVNGKSTGACKVVDKCMITIDTGTSYMTMPDKGMNLF
jgi:hypothetical protein